MTEFQAAAELGHAEGLLEQATRRVEEAGLGFDWGPPTKRPEVVARPFFSLSCYHSSSFFLVGHQQENNIYLKQGAS